MLRVVNYWSLNSGTPILALVWTSNIGINNRALTYVGPSDAWTIHGLWPDNCDGTYNSFCDPAREYTNITAILTSYKKNELLEYMKKYWKDYAGNDESFWEHEWNKHGKFPRC